MNKALLHIGFGNVVLTGRVVAIISPDTAPVKRIIGEAREKGVLVDSTHGRRTRSVILTDSGYIFLSAIQSETLAGRAVTGSTELSREETENEKTGI